MIQQSQSTRDHLELNTLESFLTQQKTNFIDLKNNSHIFLILITRNEELRVKNNLTAFTDNAQRNEEDIFSSDTTIAIIANVLLHRAVSLTQKKNALLKQTKTYETVAALSEEIMKKTEVNTKLSEKSILIKHEMIYIIEQLTLFRNQVNQYIEDHETHLIVICEKLRIEFFDLAIYINKAEKKLRDLIQLKMTANMKLCSDLKKFEKFEIQK